MGLHICAVVQRGSVSPSEYVEVVNHGAEPVPVTGLELTDCAGQHHEHVYSFPQGELDGIASGARYAESSSTPTAGGCVPKPTLAPMPFSRDQSANGR